MLSPFIYAVNPVYPQPFCQPESDLLVFSSLQIITVRQISTEQRVRLELHFNRPFDNDNRWGKLAPTIIVIERPVKMQFETDSLFRRYLADCYDLQRGEDEQIGFRLAKRLGIDRIYCVDEWGKHYDEIDELLRDENSKEYIRFETSFYDHPDSIKRFVPEAVFKEQGIIAELIELNDPEHIRRSLGNYLIGHFKYEFFSNDYIGVDFETGRWFNRNLRIFRNIQRIETGPSDRILVIFGAGHLNLLNYLFECSPEYRLEEANKYLM